jgi:hypothetical protein
VPADATGPKKLPKKLKPDAEEVRELRRVMGQNG